MWHISLTTSLLCFERTIYQMTHWASPSALDALRAQFFKVLSTMVHKTTNAKSVEMTQLNTSKCFTNQNFERVCLPESMTSTSQKQDSWRREQQWEGVIFFNWTKTKFTKTETGNTPQNPFSYPFLEICFMRLQLKRTRVLLRKKGIRSLLEKA